MKNPVNLLILIIITVMSGSCNLQRSRIQSEGRKTIEVYDLLSVKVPITFTQEILSGYNYIDTVSGTTLDFTMTDYAQYEESLPELNEDFLMSQPLLDNTETITRTDTRKISGLEVGILEKSGDLFVTRTFYAKINTRIIMCELYGSYQNVEYLDAVFNGMLKSLKRE